MSRGIYHRCGVMVEYIRLENRSLLSLTSIVFLQQLLFICTSNAHMLYDYRDHRLIDRYLASGEANGVLGKVQSRLFCGNDKTHRIREKE